MTRISTHYNDVIMGAIASQITSLTIVYLIVYSDADRRKYQSSASLTFVRGIHRGPVNSPHKWPVTRKMFPFDDVIMTYSCLVCDRTPIVMAKHGGSCVRFSGISTCGRTSPETVSHPQRQPLPTPYTIALPVYVILTNARLQTLTTTLYNSLVLSFSVLKI